jgi:hypothetical protein
MVVFLLLAAVFYFKPSKAPNPGFLLQPAPEKCELMPQEATNLIAAINSHNQLVKTFTCDMRIEIQTRFCVHATASVNYEKDRRLRMLVQSIAGRELDIGSNDDCFWFWSKRMDPPALYYSSYDHLNSSGLKTPFNPVWLKSLLGFDRIEVKNAVVCRRGQNWQVTEQTKNLQGKSVLRVTIISPDKQAIVGHFIYQDDHIVCSAEVFEQIELNGYNLPSKIVVRWYDENITMVWNLEDQTVNQPIDRNTWQMPSNRRQIDMSNPTYQTADE